jgi:uncharacterized protein (DUF433 family)
VGLQKARQNNVYVEGIGLLQSDRRTLPNKFSLSIACVFAGFSRFLMNLPIEPIAVPLQADGQGGLRVSNTQVLLERIVYAFHDGATPEGIAQSYDTLALTDVYAVLAWYLHHKAEVDQYLRGREKTAATIRRTIEATQPDQSLLRSRLMARRANEGVLHAPTRQ